MKPNIYLAGKIGKNDWRHRLVPGLRGHLWSDGPIGTPLFTYVGPFFVANNHGNNHGRNRHGAVCNNNSYDQNYEQLDVIRNNMAALEAADLVFAYIDAKECYGTLFEIGWAAHKGTRVVVVFPPRFKSSDFWYSAMQADSLRYGIPICHLQSLLNGEIQIFNRRNDLSGNKPESLREILAGF